MVEVWIEPNLDGGWFVLCLDGKHPVIHVGADSEFETKAVAVLTHEAGELIMNDLGVALKPMCFERDASDIVQFHMNHSQWTEMASRLSAFLGEVLPEFVRSFRMVNRWIKHNK